MLAEGVGLLQRQVEADHGIAVQVVMVGDCPLDEALRALLDAAREATVNAAKWSGATRCRCTPRSSGRGHGLRARPRSWLRPRRRPRRPPGHRPVHPGPRGALRRLGRRPFDPGEGAEVQLSMPRRERVIQRDGPRRHRRRTADRPGAAPHLPGRGPRRLPGRRPGRAGRHGRGGGGGRRGGGRGRAHHERLPDVVLLDVHLPGGGGMPSCAACCRTTPRCNSSPSRSPTPPRM